jgi:hypothetical protein
MTQSVGPEFKSHKNKQKTQTQRKKTWKSDNITNLVFKIIRPPSILEPPSLEPHLFWKQEDHLNPRV